MGWFEAYVADLQLQDLGENTRRCYLSALRGFRDWLAGREPTPEEARAYFATLRGQGYRPRSILHKYHALQGLFKFLGTPLKLRLRQPQTLPAYYDRADVERLIAEAGRGLKGHTPEVRRRNVAAITLMAFCGLRRAEVTALRVADVNFRQRSLLVQGKRDRQRVIPMPDRVVGPLWEQAKNKKAGEPVFAVCVETLHHAVTHLARAAGLEGFSCHSLRHAYAQRLLEAGVNIRVVQELLGHTSLATTAIYLAVLPSHLRAAVDLLDRQLEPAGRPGG